MTPDSFAASPSGKARDPRKIPVDIVNGVEGLALYIADVRMCGPKPWGGGQSVHRFTVDREELMDALCAFEQPTQEQIDEVLARLFFSDNAAWRIMLLLREDRDAWKKGLEGIE